jgi:hypothetical protein
MMKKRLNWKWLYEKVSWKREAKEKGKLKENCKD